MCSSTVATPRPTGPYELGVHPIDGPERHQLTLMCDDIESTVADLAAKGVTVTRPVRDDGYGLTTDVPLPGGGTLEIYQPKHPTAYDL